MKRFVSWKMLTAIVAAFVLGTTIVATHAHPENAQVTPSSTNTITVSGSGEASGTPDVAYVQLGIQVSNANASEALAQANSTIANVTKAIQGVGIAAEDIQTSGFNLYPQSPAEPSVSAAQPGTAPAPALIYQAQIMIMVKVKEISKVGTVIDAGTKAGANTVAGLSFGIDDQSKLEQQARIAAIANAHDRAQQLASALGMTLGDPIVVNETAGGGGPMPVAYKAVANDAMQISAGQLTVSVNLQITYTMTKK